MPVVWLYFVQLALVITCLVCGGWERNFTCKFTLILALFPCLRGENCTLDSVHVGNDNLAIGREMTTSYKFCQEVQGIEIVSRYNYLWVVVQFSFPPLHLQMDVTAQPRGNMINEIGARNKRADLFLYSGTNKGTNKGTIKGTLVSPWFRSTTNSLTTSVSQNILQVYSLF